MNDKLESDTRSARVTAKTAENLLAYFKFVQQSNEVAYCNPQAAILAVVEPRSRECGQMPHSLAWLIQIYLYIYYIISIKVLICPHLIHVNLYIAPLT